jgi:TPR repeat protein
MLKKIGMLFPISAFFSILMAMLWVSPVLCADFQKGLDAHRKEDYATAFREWMPLAEQGDARAQYFVGGLYSFGRGVERNDKQAMYWTRKSAENGYANAIYSIAEQYQLGFRVDKDINESIRWYEKLANKNDVKAQIKLGFLYEDKLEDFEAAANWYKKAIEQADDNTMYNSLGYDFEEQNGKGFALYRLGLLYENVALRYLTSNLKRVPLDNSEAVKNYKKAAELGIEDAVSQLAWLHNFGPIELRNYKEAAKWYLKLVNKGDYFAEYQLGILYEEGKGLVQDYKKAFDLYSSSSAKDSILADYRLAKLYKEGNGVAQNYKEAIRLYIKVSDQPNNYYASAAEVNLSSLYLEGKGVPQIYKKGFEWVRKAAENHPAYNTDLRAYLVLAFLYEGGVGTTQNYKQAVIWSRKAALGGMVEAQFTLSKFYSNGVGVLQNNIYPHMWSNVAASLGSKEAQELRDIISKRMTTEDLSKAQELARRCVENNYKQCEQ